ncbi:MAG: transposase, partial [Armatimonadota bacterium]|nr:transposase [Armatimonadota bacterium]
MRGGILRSTVSELCKSLEGVVSDWNGRDLSGQEYPFLLVDALIIRVRKGGRVRLSSVLLATGTDREVLGLFGPSPVPTSPPPSRTRDAGTTARTPGVCAPPPPGWGRRPQPPA